MAVGVPGAARESPGPLLPEGLLLYAGNTDCRHASHPGMDAAMEHVITAQGLTRRFGARTVVDGLDLAIPAQTKAGAYTGTYTVAVNYP